MAKPKAIFRLVRTPNGKVVRQAITTADFAREYADGTKSRGLIPTDLPADKYRDCVIGVLLAINAGLTERLCRHPHTRSAGEWLRKRFQDEREVANWVNGLIVMERQHGPEIAGQCLQGLTSLIAGARPPRGNAPCNCLTVCWQYEYASQTWRDAELKLPRGFRGILRAHQRESSTKIDQWVDNLDAVFRHGYLSCACGGPKAPLTVDRFKPREQRGPAHLIEYLVGQAHQEPLTLDAVRRLRAEGAKHLRALPKAMQRALR